MKILQVQVELVIDKNMLMSCYSSFYSENVKNVKFHRQSDEWLALAHRRQSKNEKTFTAACLHHRVTVNHGLQR